MAFVASRWHAHCLFTMKHGFPLWRLKRHCFWCRGDGCHSPTSISSSLADTVHQHRRSNKKHPSHHSTTALKNERTHFKNAAPGLRPFAVSMFLPVFLLSQHGWGSKQMRTHTTTNPTSGTTAKFNKNVIQLFHEVVVITECGAVFRCFVTIHRCKQVWQVSKTTVEFHSSLLARAMRRVVEVGAVGGRCEW